MAKIATTKMGCKKWTKVKFNKIMSALAKCYFICCIICNIPITMNCPVKVAYSDAILKGVGKKLMRRTNIVSGE